MRSNKATQRNAKLRTASLRGFTAAELSAVAAIIAILALIIVPVFRDRVDEARRVGTLDDMQGLAKGILLANADTSLYPRLNDLDNGEVFNDPPFDTASEVPIGLPLRVNPFAASERQALANLWQGPYNAIQNSITLEQLENFYPDTIDDNNGPLRIYSPLVAGGSATADSLTDTYPVDHFGNPYLYYPPGRYTVALAAQGNETQFSGGLLVSFGQNGLIGDGTAIVGGQADPTNNPYRRESGIPGSGDDLVYFF